MVPTCVGTNLGDVIFHRFNFILIWSFDGNKFLFVSNGFEAGFLGFQLVAAVVVAVAVVVAAAAPATSF